MGLRSASSAIIWIPFPSSNKSFPLIDRCDYSNETRSMKRPMLRWQGKKYSDKQLGCKLEFSYPWMRCCNSEILSALYPLSEKWTATPYDTCEFWEDKDRGIRKNTSLNGENSGTNCSVNLTIFIGLLDWRALLSMVYTISLAHITNASPVHKLGSSIL